MIDESTQKTKKNKKDKKNYSSSTNLAEAEKIMLELTTRKVNKKNLQNKNENVITFLQYDALKISLSKMRK